MQIMYTYGTFQTENNLFITYRYQKLYAIVIDYNQLFYYLILQLCFFSTFTPQTNYDIFKQKF